MSMKTKKTPRKYMQFTHQDFVELINNRGYTIEELHAETGISVTTLYDYRRDRYPIPDRASAVFSKMERINELETKLGRKQQ